MIMLKITALFALSTGSIGALLSSEVGPEFVLAILSTFF
jgi:hypothetical protein